MKDLTSIPFRIEKEKNLTTSIFNKYNKLYEKDSDIINNLNAFQEYFISFWNPFFLNESFNYKNLDKNFRSNSYIENYNKRIKDLLGKYKFNNYIIIKYIAPYLGYNGFSVIPWPLFLSFIINEEYNYTISLINDDKKPPKKVINNINKSNNIIINNDVYFLKYNLYSCRYDSFFLIQSFVINLYIDKNNIKLENESSKTIKKIGDILFNLNKDNLDKGLWEIIDFYNLDNIGITSNTLGYKNLFPISNIFNWLKKENFFCIKYNEITICNNCGYNKNEIFYFTPLIPINLVHLNCKDLSEVIRLLFEPTSSSCEKCSFENYAEGILKKNSFFMTCKQKIIKSYNLPDLLSFIFDLSNEHERDENQYNNLIKLKDEYKHLIQEEIIIDKKYYKLVGTINQQTINHYSSCIINNTNKIKNLEINRSYYYDGKDGSI